MSKLEPILVIQLQGQRWSLHAFREQVSVHLSKWGKQSSPEMWHQMLGQSLALINQLCHQMFPDFDQNLIYSILFQQRSRTAVCINPSRPDSFHSFHFPHVFLPLYP